MKPLLLPQTFSEHLMSLSLICRYQITPLQILSFSLLLHLKFFLWLICCCYSWWSPFFYTYQRWSFTRFCSITLEVMMCDVGHSFCVLCRCNSTLASYMQNGHDQLDSSPGTASQRQTKAMFQREGIGWVTYKLVARGTPLCAAIMPCVLKHRNLYGAYNTQGTRQLTSQAKMVNKTHVEFHQP